MSHPPSSVSALRSLIVAFAALCVGAAAQVPDTIQSGTLRPLETLPSLGPSTSMGPSLLPSDVQQLEGLAPASPAIPSGTAAPMPMPGGTVPALPVIPSAAVPSVPAPSPAPAPASADTPPPLPTAVSHVITEPLAQAYLYVEPYQARAEVLFDAATMFAFLLPDAPVPESLTPELQKQLREKGATAAVQWCSMSSSGERLTTPPAQTFVIKGLPGNTLPLKEDESVPLNQALVGFMWEFPAPPVPAELTLTWHGWFGGRTLLPLKVFFGTQSEPGEINSTIKTYRWRNQDRLPRPAPLAAVPAWEQEPPIDIPVGGVVWLLGGLTFYVYLKIKDRRLPGGSMPYIAVWLLGAVLMSRLLVIPYHPGPSGARVTEVADAQRIVSPLLRNVYRAFDHRSESDVYDVLERSVQGDLLRRLYLETIQALTLEGREGTRVNITEFQVTVDKVLPSPTGEGFLADCNWMARGLVGHWGHTHQRLNIYTARLTLIPVKEEWKLTGLEVQEVRRL